MEKEREALSVDRGISSGEVDEGTVGWGVRLFFVVLDGEKKSLDGVMSLDSGFRTELKGGEGVMLLCEVGEAST